MKKLLLMSMGALALTACAPLSIYHKPGVSVALLERETLDCEVSALRDAPVANEIRVEPPVYIPPRSSCDAAGRCTYTRGYWEAGDTYTVDVNEELRERVEVQCMADKGFVPAQIPICPNSIRVTGRTDVLPRLTQNSCAIQNEDGSYFIINRG